MQHSRVRKLNSLLRDQLSLVIYEECDWTHPLVLSITEVDTAPDLSNCKVKISMVGDAEQKQSALNRLRHEASHLRYMLAKRIQIRKMPFVQFNLDESIETGERVRALIEQVTGDKN